MSNIKRPWTKIIKTNSRVIVEQRYCNSDREMMALAEELNGLFKEHKDWSDTSAFLEQDEVEICCLCGHNYEEVLGEKNEFICAYCGKGEKEMILKKLEGEIK